VDGNILEQRARNRLLSRLGSAVLAPPNPSPHQGQAHFRHDGLDVGEIDVDVARMNDEIGNTLHRVQEYVIDPPKTLKKGRASVGQAEQPVVGDGNEGIDHPLEGLEAFFGVAQPDLAFNQERLGDDRYGECSQFLADLGRDGGTTGPRTAPQACGNEHHIAAVNRFPDLLQVFLGRLGAGFRVATRPQTLGEIHSQLNLHWRQTSFQSLEIGIGRDELDAVEPRADHVIDGITAPATNSQHLDFRSVQG